MNILTKLSKAIDEASEVDNQAREIVSLQGHIKSIEYRKLPNFVVYSSRRVRSQLSV